MSRSININVKKTMKVRVKRKVINKIRSIKKEEIQKHIKIIKMKLIITKKKLNSQKENNQRDRLRRSTLKFLKFPKFLK